ncbi:MAG: protein kinase [Gemmatimonadaceae bacterium]|nr:protein kinase [Gemmatimonadaceae bacterium]
MDMVGVARCCPSCDGEVPAGALSCPTCGAISPPPTSSRSDTEGIARRIQSVVGARYAIERTIGRGGMAIVFLAQDLRHHRAVAIKVLLPELSPVTGPDRFLREIEIAAQLSHPHIVPLYDSGEADGLLYYVMPFVEGASLRHRIAHEGALPIHDVAQIAREVADALAYAHALGVIHRDIKPENILLTHHHATVADFGVARALHATWGSAASTTGGVALGTPHYMSPEQAESSPLVDHRTDIYALGCTIYEMLTGRPPFAGPGTLAVLAQHLGEPIPLPSALRKDVPPEFDHVVQRAMAKAPAGRFASAGDMSTALAALTTPAISGPSVVATRARRFRRTALALAIGLVGIATAYVVRTRRASTREASAPQTLKVVVRAFDHASPDLKSAADRLTATLSDQLMAVPALHVTSSAAVVALHEASLDSLRAKYNPDRIVVGSIENVRDEQVRIVVRIVDPASARALSADSVTVAARALEAESTTDILSLRVRHALWNELSTAQRRARVRDPAAWSLLVRAGELMGEAENAIVFRLDQTGFRSLFLAESLLTIAHQKDRASDLIRLEQATVHERRAIVVEYLHQQLARPPATLPRAADERGRALAILDQLIASRDGPADAFELRGMVKLGLYRSLRADSLLDGAIADERSATERDLHLATAWEKLANVQREAGRFADALFSVQRAFEEDAFKLLRVKLLRVQFDAALRTPDYGLAAKACKDWMAEALPEQRVFDCELELWSRTANDRRTAERASARADSLRAGGDSLSLTEARRRLHVAQVMARAGLTERADALERSLPLREPKGWRPMIPLERAYLRLLRGDPDSAVALIVASIDDDPTIARHVGAVPWFQSLTTDPRLRLRLRGSTAKPPPRATSELP